MADLTAEKRKGMPKKDFAGSGKSFPVNDKEHARLAISGATRSKRAGNISEEQEEKIKAKARRKLKTFHHFLGGEK
jgi:hypothetical protein